MTYKGHAVGGAVAAYAIWQVTPTFHGPLAAAMIFLALFGSQIPDVDHKGSWIGRRLRLLYYMFRWSLSNPLTWTFIGYRRMRSFVAHRGFTHTLLALFLSSLLTFVVVLYGLEQLSLANGGLDHLSVTANPVDLFGFVTLSYIVPALYLTAGWAAGYWSHLFLDMATVSGCALFEPWNDRDCHILPSFLLVRMKR